jgi:hypothetical protein
MWLQTREDERLISDLA